MSVGRISDLPPRGNARSIHFSLKRFVNLPCKEKEMLLGTDPPFPSLCCKPQRDDTRAASSEKRSGNIVPAYTQPIPSVVSS